MADVLDYTDRPAKRLARSILVETLQRLRTVDRLGEYAYVGLGAYQFVDFDLVHRKLGITRMTSIEGNHGLVPRCEFNRPFSFIEVKEGYTTTVLPGLDWTRRSIVWLDYTSRLKTSVMDDCRALSIQLLPGSVLAVTFNCEPGKMGNRVGDFKQAVGAEDVPLRASENTLGGWGLAEMQRDIFTSLIERTLVDRGDKSSWRQLLNIHYKDGARMQLIAGVVDHPEVHEQIQACRFDDMEEASPDQSAVELALVPLTIRERQALDRFLTGGSVEPETGLQKTQIDAYAKYYQWLDPLV